MTKTRDTTDIAQEILLEMKKAGAVVTYNETDICDIIFGLRKLAELPLARGFKTETTKHVTKMLKWIEQGKALFHDQEQQANNRFILDEPSSAAQNSLIGIIEKLDRMQLNCQWVLDNNSGVHKNSGYQQERAAIIARGLMEMYALPLAYSSPTSAYRATARLFFESMNQGSLEDGEDIERACEVVAKLPMLPGRDVLARL